MCDVHPHGRLGWRGWRELPPRRATVSTGDWHDLSHRLHNDLPVPHVFPQPRLERVMSMPDGKLNVTRLEIVCHVGTHLDAPSHLFMDAPGFDGIPADRLHGPGVVWGLDLEPFGEITPDLLDTMTPRVEAGDMVLLCARWSERWGDESYLSNPSLTVAAAQWLLDRGISLLGVDFATPDAALSRRAADFDWPVHKLLLGNGILIAENLAGLAPLAGHRVEIVCGALNLDGADGSPARIFARRAADAAEHRNATP